MPSFKALLLACTVSLLPLLSTPVHAADAFTPAQKKEIEEIVRELITKKEPEMVIHAAQTVQERMEKESVIKGQEGVDKNLDKILNDPSSPVSGNPKGDVTIVEFFDYSCGYCKMAQGSVEKILDSDKNLRFVYKELPILGPNSLLASQYAVASIEQGKYPAFHRALMEAKQHLTESAIIDIAKEVGLDTDKLKKDIGSEKVQKILKTNIALAKEIGAQGTPTFIIGGKLFPGALSYEQIQEAVEKVRADKKK